MVQEGPAFHICLLNVNIAYLQHTAVGGHRKCLVETHPIHEHPNKCFVLVASPTADQGVVGLIFEACLRLSWLHQ